MELYVYIDKCRKIVTIRTGSFTTVEYNFEDESEIGEVIQEFYNEYVK